MSKAPIVLFTDYGVAGPYVGLLHAVIQRELPGHTIVDLQHDLPPFRPRGAGLLLASHLEWLPQASIVVAVVDPGVGSERKGLVIDCEGQRLVGPDNGLFAPFLRRAERVRVIDWLPGGMSATFHGRDWFAPVALRLAVGRHLEAHTAKPADCVGYEWASDLNEVIYVDGFGNLVTGLAGGDAATVRTLSIDGRQIRYARTFAEAPQDSAFWHVNSLGLVELAVSQGSAAKELGLGVGDRAFDAIV